MFLVPFAVAIAQADDLLAIAEHFGRQRRCDDGDVRQAAQFRLQHRVGAQLAIEFDQRHMRDEPREVDRRLDPRIAAADHRDALALEQRAVAVRAIGDTLVAIRSEEHTSELQSLMRISYAVFCLKKKNTPTKMTNLQDT